MKAMNKNKTTLQRECEEYFDNVEKSGGKTLKFSCPHCNATLKTLVNDTNQPWNTLSTCWYCEKSFMKITPGQNQPVETCIIK